MDVQKIIYSPDLTIIEWLRIEGVRSEKIETRDASTATPEFLADWMQLPTLANEILESMLLNADIGFKVTSIMFKRDKADNLGCILHICAELETSSRPLNFNTPVKYELGEGREESPLYLSGQSADLLKRLQKHAVNIIERKPAQQELKLEMQDSLTPICEDCNLPAVQQIGEGHYCQQHAQAALEKL